MNDDINIRGNMKQDGDMWKWEIKVGGNLISWGLCDKMEDASRELMERLEEEMRKRK